MKLFKSIVRRVFSVLAAVALTLSLFLVLPLMQAIAQKDEEQYVVQQVSAALEEPPQDVKEEEEEPPKDVEDPPEPPKIDLDQPVMTDITMLDVLPNGTGISIPRADSTINIDQAIGGSTGPDNLFDPGALDQPARVLFQAQPKMSADLRRKVPATVVLVLIVDSGGRVSEVNVLKSSDSAFNNAAISAVKQWRFEPAQRGGKPIEARLMQTIEFPK